MSLLYKLLDRTELLLSKKEKKGSLSHSHARMLEEAYKVADLITGRHDVPDRIPSNQLVVEPGREDLVKRMGAELIDGVWTVPEGMEIQKFSQFWPMIPADLRDKVARNTTTKNGDPIEGYLRPDDIVRGGDSTATPLMYGALPVIGALAYLVSLVSPLLSLLVMLLATPFLITIAQGEGIIDSVKSFFVLLVGPAALAAMAANGARQLESLNLLGSIRAGGIQSVVTASLSLATLSAVVFTVAFVLMLASNMLDSKYKASVIGGFWARVRYSAKLALVFTLVMVLSVAILPTSMLPFAFYFMASMYPMIHTESNYNSRAKELEALGITFKLGRMGKLSTVHVEPRILQAKIALADKSPTMVVGCAEGLLSAKHHPNAPDSGQEMVLSAIDATSHILVFGSSGVGKTSSTLRPWIKQWTENNMGSVFVADAKGSLPGEVSSLIDLRIGTGVDYAPMQGLDAQGVYNAVKAIKVKSAKSSENPIWDNGAMDHIDNITILHEALHEHELVMINHSRYLASVKEDAEIWYSLEAVRLEKDGKDPTEALEKARVAAELKVEWSQKAARERKWLWNLDTLSRLVIISDNLKSDGPNLTAGDEMLAALSELGYGASEERRSRMPESIHPEIGAGGLLDGTIEYFLGSWPNKGELRSSFMSNVNDRIQPLTRGKYLTGKSGVHWKMLEKGEDVRVCLYGKNVGIDLPETIHGRAGVAITAFAKQCVYDSIKMRATTKESDWRAMGQTPLLLVFDEAQDLVGEAESALIPKSRSMRMAFCCATQSIESLIERFNDANSARKFADTFQSIFCLESSSGTYKYMKERLGKADLISFKQRSNGIDYSGALKNYALSPLNDPDHPNRAGMESLLRRGFGKLIVRAPTAPMQYVGGKWVGNKTRQLDENSMLTDITVPVGGVLETVDVFEDQEFNSLLTTGKAIVSLRRAGGKRVDLVKLLYVGPDELRKDKVA
ncbi:TraM recognition domain-containing protein [Stenotrophomonas maltophilia]|uniref:TraM recognition domain-containing protein n=1 Tax=Stenotrophomonas maltophilia TaxID=40324 RepID=UPI003BF7AC8D